jgi:hypothetical protein
VNSQPIRVQFLSQTNAVLGQGPRRQRRELFGGPGNRLVEGILRDQLGQQARREQLLLGRGQLGGFSKRSLKRVSS